VTPAVFLVTIGAMRIVRLAAATLNQTPLDWRGNLRRIEAVIADARKRGATLLVLPELAISGYGCEDAFLSVDTARLASESLAALLPKTRGMAVVVGLPVYHDGSMYNCAAMVQDGKLLGINPKRFLPREGVHYEPRWFAPWPVGAQDETQLLGKQVPFGGLIYDLGGPAGSTGIAIALCEEAWGAVTGAAGIAAQIDIVLNPSASHFALGKYATREQLVLNSSRAMQVVYVYANLVGNEAGRVIYDGGVFVAQSGSMLARGRRFGYSDGEVTICDVDLDQGRTGKLRATSVRAAPQSDLRRGGGRRDHSGRGSETLSGDTNVRGRPLATSAAGQPLPASSRAGGKADAAPLAKNEEFLRAEMLGLFDYLRKSGAKGFALPMSGGCDSATCAVLIAHMIADGVAELGIKGFATRIGRPDLATGKSDPRRLIKALLTGFYQASSVSSKTTRAAAHAVADEIGAEFVELDIAPVVDACLGAVRPALGRALGWKRDDLALQNIQPRARAATAWLIANVRGALLITTGNRSEGSVGYTTMDGDAAGGLAPLAGVDKHFLRGWLKWAETDNNFGLGPLKSLAATNRLQPTAELRPGAAKQTDEDDLMPYEILARIERLFVRDKMAPREIATTLQREFPKRARRDLDAWLARFLSLWQRSQWKRDRLAPGFMLDDFNIDSRGWCRWPILGGEISIGERPSSKKRSRR